MANTDNVEFQKQLQKAIDSGQHDEAQKLLMQQALDSGELTKAFAQAWASKMVNGGGSNNTEADNASDTDEKQQEKRQTQKQRGVSVN